MNPAHQWPENCGDGCGNFFGACLREAYIDVPVNAHVLEIGCAEFDWLAKAAAVYPQMQFWGIDWRPTTSTERSHTIQGDARDPSQYEPESFDWIVSISAIEHMGLGHYANDPKAVDGDTEVMANAFRWLKPGGWLVFDVPYQPDAYEVCGTSHRIYNAEELFHRLWCEPLARAKATARWAQTSYASARNPGELIPHKPTERDSEFYYVGCMWQKLS